MIFNSANNLNWYSSAASAVYSYDDSSNLTFDSLDDYEYQYDAENQLTIAATASPQQVITYTYAASGRRISKTVNGAVTKYVYDGSQVIAEYDGFDRLRRKFVYGTGIDEVIMLADLPQKTDLTDDGIVDVEDLLVLAQNWLCESNYFDFDPNADLDDSGIINFEDYAVLANYWRADGNRDGCVFLSL